MAASSEDLLPQVAEIYKNKGLKGRVAIVTGASRGIGRELCLAFARAGASVVVTAKTTEEIPNLPGTIFSVAKEVEALGAACLPVACDVRSEEQVRQVVEQTIKQFGRIDILVNNAGALWWKNVDDTPMKRYDLINGINSRGSFLFTQTVLPFMKKQKWGSIINCSPPIDLAMLKGKVAYCISKFGMTMLAHGLADELADQPDLDIQINALWPATMIESAVTVVFEMGDRSLWRKPSIISDTTLLLIADRTTTGQALIDEDYLTEKHHITDFKRYRCVADVEPPRLTATYVQLGKKDDPNNTKLRGKIIPAKL